MCNKECYKEQDVPEEKELSMDIEINGLPVMSKWKLFFWRFKRLLTPTVEVQVDIVDLHTLIQPMVEHDMSPGELMAYALSHYIRNRK